MKFMYFDKVTAALECGMRTGNNVLLYGPPGHGKTEGTVLFLSDNGIKDPFVKTFNPALTVEDIFGGVDLKLLQEKGEIRYRVESPQFFGNHEYVIFEEIFDANKKVLAALKDVLMSREVRNGDQRYPIKTKMVIGLTNVDQKDFQENWESLAILERFPVRHLVKWEDYSVDSFHEFAKHMVQVLKLKVNESVIKEFATAASLSQETKHPISPRTLVISLKAAALRVDYGREILIGQAEATDPEIPETVALKWRIESIKTRIRKLKAASDLNELNNIRLKLSLWCQTNKSSPVAQDVEKIVKSLDKELVSDLNV